MAALDLREAKRRTSLETAWQRDSSARDDGKRGESGSPKVDGGRNGRNAVRGLGGGSGEGGGSGGGNGGGRVVCRISDGGGIDGGAGKGLNGGGSAMRDADSNRSGSPRRDSPPRRGQPPPLIEIEGTRRGSVKSHAQQIDDAIRSGR